MPGCDVVIFSEPLSSSSNINKEIIEGIWKNISKYDRTEVHFQLNDDGLLQMEFPNEEEFGISKIYLKQGRNYKFASISAHEKSQKTPMGYFLVQYELCEKYLIAWVMDVDVFKNAIDTNELRGRYSYSSSKLVFITSPPHTVLDFLYESVENQKSFHNGAMVAYKVEGLNKSDLVISPKQCIDPEIQYQIGSKFYEMDDGAKAVEWLQKASEQGHLQAIYTLSDILYLGKIYPQDDDKAVALLRSVAELGESEAQYRLAKAYYFGIGLPKDDKKTLKWLLLSSDQKHKQAIRKLIWLLSTSPDSTVRDGYKAVQLAEQYITKPIYNTFSYELLAAAYAEAGRYEDAINNQLNSFYKNELDMLDSNDPKLEDYGKYHRLLTYKKHQPYRDLERQFTRRENFKMYGKYLW